MGQLHPCFVPRHSPKSPSEPRLLSAPRSLWELLRRDRGWCHSHRDTMGTHSSGEGLGLPHLLQDVCGFAQGRGIRARFSRFLVRVGILQEPPVLGLLQHGPAGTERCWGCIHPKPGPAGSRGAAEPRDPLPRGFYGITSSLRGDSTGIWVPVRAFPSLAGLEEPSTPSP